MLKWDSYVTLTSKTMQFSTKFQLSFNLDAGLSVMAQRFYAHYYFWEFGSFICLLFNIFLKNRLFLHERDRLNVIKKKYSFSIKILFLAVWRRFRNSVNTNVVRSNLQKIWPKKLFNWIFTLINLKKKHVWSTEPWKCQNVLV